MRAVRQPRHPEPTRDSRASCPGAPCDAPRQWQHWPGVRRRSGANRPERRSETAGPDCAARPGGPARAGRQGGARGGCERRRIGHRGELIRRWTAFSVGLITSAPKFQCTIAEPSAGGPAVVAFEGWPSPGTTRLSLDPLTGFATASPPSGRELCRGLGAMPGGDSARPAWPGSHAVGPGRPFRGVTAAPFSYGGFIGQTHC